MKKELKIYWCSSNKCLDAWFVIAKRSRDAKRFYKRECNLSNPTNIKVTLICHVSDTFQYKIKNMTPFWASEFILKDSGFVNITEDSELYSQKVRKYLKKGRRIVYFKNKVYVY